MRILLTAATPPEIKPTLEWLMTSASEQQENRLHFPDCTVEVSFTGIGPVRTAFSLGTILDRQAAPNLAIQAGIAGAYDRNLELGQVVHVRSDRLIDDGAEDRDGSLLSLSDIGFPYVSPFRPGGELIAPATNAVLPFEEVIGGTVSRATGSEASIARIKERYPHVQTETMEGAAFMYACLSLGVDALQLRSISNYVEPRDRSTWQIGPALESLNAALQRILHPFLKFS